MKLLGLHEGLSRYPQYVFLIISVLVTKSILLPHPYQATEFLDALLTELGIDVVNYLRVLY